MRLYLINPSNPLVNTAAVRNSRLIRYRVRKPLGLLVVAGLTPPEWDVTVIDENLGMADYAAMPRPDLVGITAFTAQADRAYQVAAMFRAHGVPVVMGGIHATMRLTEALERVDAVVTGEAEGVWEQVLEDVRRGALQRVYSGNRSEGGEIGTARHDLSPRGYMLGSIQTTRGCPLNCSFCSVTAFNGGRYRHRPIADVIREFEMIREKAVLVVDDNLIGTRADHIARTKELFRAMIRAKLGKKWVTQATINMADDEELLALAARAGCIGVFIGFESPSAEGLLEVHKRFNLQEGRDFRASVRRIQRHGIIVEGSFILGLDVDASGAGQRIAEAADRYGVDVLNVLLLTPLPGTRLWEKFESEGRILADNYPEDWKYYTLRFPVARYKHLSWADMLREREACARAFYAYPRIARRALGAMWRARNPLIGLAALIINLSCRGNYRNLRLDREASRGLDVSRGQALA